LSLQEASEITIEDREALRRAVKSLEHPSLAGRLTNLVGKPVELIGYALPSFASKAIASATSKGLEAALKVALRTLRSSPRTNSQFLHRALATASGAAGGTFGLAALPVELPVSTTIMLRSIADIARSEGEDLSDPETALACVEVFALGGRAGSADASESGYFAVRGMLAKTVTEAARFPFEHELRLIMLGYIADLDGRLHVTTSDSSSGFENRQPLDSNWAREDRNRQAHEGEHYFKCELCGGYFDMHDLGAVEHEEPLRRPACDQVQ
jgi:hypothetical protein